MCKKCPKQNLLYRKLNSSHSLQASKLHNQIKTLNLKLNDKLAIIFSFVILPTAFLYKMNCFTDTISYRSCPARIGKPSHKLTNTLLKLKSLQHRTPVLKIQRNLLISLYYWLSEPISEPDQHNRATQACKDHKWCSKD